MRVAYLLKRFPRLSQTLVLDEVLELERQGVDLVVLARRGSDEALVHRRVADLRAPVHLLHDASGPANVAQTLRDLGADHVHAHFATWAGTTAEAAAALAGLPFSVTAHATDLYRADVDRDTLASRIAAARFVVTVTEDNRAWLQRLLDERGLSGRVVRLHNGMDLARLARSTAAREPGLVAAVGRLVEKKVLRRPARRPVGAAGAGPRRPAGARGRGPLRDGLGEQAHRLGLDAVRWLGARPQEEVLDLVGRAEVLALPSVVAADGDRDALPTVVLEAMALGTPVASTRVSGIPEMVEDGVSGLLVEQRDPPALAAALARLLDDPALGQRCAAAARTRVEERFSLPTNVAQLRGLFQGTG